MKPLKFILALGFCALLLSGSSQKSTAAIVNSKHVRIGYIGLTCEAPIFTAYEKGFFKEEGLEPELVKCAWANYKDTLALGGYDITHHLVMYFLKPIEQGLDVRFLAGIHRGCLRVQAGVKTNIHTIQDLKGKRIGVPGMGTPPFVFANRVFGTHGIDPAKDITWKVFPAGELRNIADQMTDAPYKDEYCCEVIANGKWVDANPDTAARATRAMLKGAKWVETNPKAAAVMAVEKKYLASTAELNTTALAGLRYVPSVHLAEESVRNAGREMKVAKMLSPETDTEALAKRAFMHLPGVTDEWIKTLEVEKVAGGQMLPGQDIRTLAEAILSEKEDCCLLSAQK